jgi:hypothetical protein
VRSQESELSDVSSTSGDRLLQRKLSLSLVLLTSASGF